MGSVLLSRVVVASLLAGLVACQGGYTPPTCETVSPCKCRYPSGNGFDLSNATVVPEVPMSPTNETKTVYFFNPCPPLPGVNNTCPGNAALCSQSAEKVLKVLGGHTNVTFGKITLPINATTGKAPPALQYVQYLYLDESNNTKTTTVILKCAYAGLSSSISEDPDQPGRLILTSKSACFTTVPPPPAEDEGLSAGATFLVLFFTLFSAYFFGGMAVLKFIKGAQGFEMIPNYEFWTGLPSLVKDGFLFALSGCQGAASYDRI